jgi:hypothetical protein
MLYQRSREQSGQAIPKPYHFVRLTTSVNPSPLVKELEAVAISWLPSQWKWHMGTFFCILRGGPGGRHPGSALTSGADTDAPVLDCLPLMRVFLNETFPAPARMAWLGLCTKLTSCTKIDRSAQKLSSLHKNCWLER